MFILSQLLLKRIKYNSPHDFLYALVLSLCIYCTLYLYLLSKKCHLNLMLYIVLLDVILSSLYYPQYPQIQDDETVNTDTSTYDDHIITDVEEDSTKIDKYVLLESEEEEC